MQYKHAIVLLTVIVLLAQGIFVSQTAGPAQSSSQTQLPEPKGTSQTATLPGEKPLIANVIQNSGFEDLSYSGTPVGWNTYGSSYSRQNTSYMGLVHDGAYSGRLEAKGTNTWGGDSQIARSFYSTPRPYLTQGITLDSYSYVVSNPDLLTSGQFWMQLDIYAGGNYVQVYYFLSFHNLPSNYTWGAYYLLNSSIGNWNHLQRNVTRDYEAWFGTVQSTFYLYSVRYYMYSPSQPTGLLETVIDDLSVTNRTSYQFAPNGDFENGNGNYWSTYGQYEPTILSQTSDHTEGSFAFNMSCSATQPNMYGYAYLSDNYNYPGAYFGTTPGDCIIECDYKYQDTHNGGSDQCVYLYAYFQNRSTSVQAYWYLGTDLDGFPFSNGSNYFYMKANGFGIRGTWNHLFADVGLLFKEKHITNVAITTVSLTLNLGQRANSSVQVLIDDLSMYTYPLGDPGFEQDSNLSFDPVPSWFVNYGGSPYVSHSSSSRTGNWAANLTAYSGVTAGIYRDSWFEIDPGTFTDFYWRLDVLPPNLYAIAVVTLTFDYSWNLNYILASVGYSYGNGSYSACYFAEGLNETGGWHRLFRNVTADLDAVFGSHKWNLTKCELVAYGGSGGGKISVLFDDMNFIDKQPPMVHTVSRNPLNPMYYNEVQVTIDTTDNMAGIDTIRLYYQEGSNPWTAVDAALIGGHYYATIHSVSYGTLVKYYVNATDKCGSIAIAGASSYVPGDDIAPLLNIESPDQNDVVAGIVSIETSASDAGSGISFVEFWIDGSWVANRSGPYEYVWNTRSYPNNTHTVLAKAHDKAGVITTDSVMVTTANDFSGPALSAIQLDPTNPQYDQPVGVYVAATDESAVASVSLFYRMGSGSWHMTPMTASGALYTATVPYAIYDTHVSYYIVAHDIYNATSMIGSSTSPLSYTVGDSISPTVTVNGPSANVPVVGTVWFLISANDGTGGASGIGEFQFLVDGSPAASSPTVPANFTWDTTSVVDGYHSLTFRVIDRAGNPTSIALVYYVGNAGPGWIAGLGYAMSAYGFFIGAGATVAALIVWKLLLPRYIGKKGK